MRPQPGPFRHRLPAGAGARPWCSPSLTPAASVVTPRRGRRRARPGRRHPRRRRRVRPRSRRTPAEAAPSVLPAQPVDAHGRRARPLTVQPAAPAAQAGREPRRHRRRPRRPRPAAAADRAHPAPQPVTATARSGVTWDRRASSPDDAITASGAHPDRRHLVALDRRALRRRARPRPGHRRGPPRAPRHRRRCSSATSTRSRSARPSSRRRCPPTCSSRSIDPGTGHRRPSTERAGDRHQHHGRRHRHGPRSTRPPRRADRPPTATGAGDGATPARPRRSRPKPVIYSRAQWGADERMRDAGSLHYGEVHAGFVHHTVNANDYTRAEVPGDHPQHLRLPHAVPRLERHRLQLPRRPVRPDLGGPLRRRRPARRRRPHPRLQRLLLRDVGDRQLRDRPARRRR